MTSANTGQASKDTPISVTLGFDVGTSSSKGVLVDSQGNILAQATRPHEVSRPEPGWHEMDPELWWEEFQDISRELLAHGHYKVAAVGASGMGPCVAIADRHGVPLHPAILYGVDTRATQQIQAQNTLLGAEDIYTRCGSFLSSQSVGPKLQWLEENESESFKEARMFFMPSSWIVYRSTGQYVLDHHSASQSTPLYDLSSADWYEPWFEKIAPQIDRPRLLWPDEQAGTITAEAELQTGIPAGTPVIAGTVDAWAEAISVGATRTNDTMLMYGTTLFIVHHTQQSLRHHSLWSTAGTRPGTYCLAAGLATSGAITQWIRELTQTDYESLFRAAEKSGPGAKGLVMLPYFSGERTPLHDPQARGVLAGLELSHTQGDIFRSALEGVGYAVRHNLETFKQAGGTTQRMFAVGGGTTSKLWPQIISEILGTEQIIRKHAIGASLGMAFLAASLFNDPDIERWNPILYKTQPIKNPVYEARYQQFRALYPATKNIVHDLSRK
ncbi:FGGY-family carbohydrate kinase [Glutamicibacter creatinolyticus]|uniref:FGGY-family carbohydrate kinase n=1 Tax=Glutamicibacter creatinolyticus TaxID=162496 RepID=UPI0037C14ABA